MEATWLPAQLTALGCPDAKCVRIRAKDGVHVYRVADGPRRWVLKYFENPEYRREIAYYRLLASLGVPTLTVAAATEDALLLEDVEASPTLRLGKGQDMRDPAVLRAVGHWYRLLHEKGRGLPPQQCQGLYCEYNALTEEALDTAALRSGTQDAPCWQALRRAVPLLQERLAAAQLTLTYNDFHFSNLVVARDRSTALMYDYNLLGLGLAASDTANVCYSMSPVCRAAFKETCGPADPAEEALALALEGPVALALAGKRAMWPAWANGLLQQALKGTLEARLRALA